MTRKGTPCAAPVAWDKRLDRPVNGRCRCHGGASTGPRTDAGREAIRESNRRRAVLRDLAELVPEIEAERRDRWADAILALVYGYPNHAGGRGLREAGKAAGVGRQTVHRWRQHPGFVEAERRACARWWTWWTRRQREERRRKLDARLALPLSVAVLPFL